MILQNFRCSFCYLIFVIVWGIFVVQAKPESIQKLMQRIYNELTYHARHLHKHRLTYTLLPDCMDGDSLFRALAVARSSARPTTQLTPETLRRDAVDHIRWNLKDFRHFFLQDDETPSRNTNQMIQEKLDAMAEPGTWVTYDCFLALTLVLQSTILVTMVSGDDRSSRRPTAQTLDLLLWQ